MSALEPGVRLVAGARWDNTLEELLPGLLVPKFSRTDKNLRAAFLPKFLVCSKPLSHQTAYWVHTGEGKQQFIHVIGTARAYGSVVKGHRIECAPSELETIGEHRVTTLEKTVVDLLLDDPEYPLSEKHLKTLNRRKLMNSLGKASGRPKINAVRKRLAAYLTPNHPN